MVLCAPPRALEVVGLAEFAGRPLLDEAAAVEGVTGRLRTQLEELEVAAFLARAVLRGLNTQHAHQIAVVQYDRERLVEGPAADGAAHDATLSTGADSMYRRTEYPRASASFFAVRAFCRLARMNRDTVMS